MTTDVLNGPGFKSCVFCGFTGKLSGEHVFPKWLQRIGLSPEPVPHVSGPLNRSPRSIGVSPPFRRTVRDVCKPCNETWMSNLEVVAKRVLAPLILGSKGSVAKEDHAAIAAWIQKTTLVGMLVSSPEEKSRGSGLPPEEYRSLYVIRDCGTPLSNSQFWIGRYQGEQRMSSIWATPMIVKIDGLVEPNGPQAYVMTVILGQVILQGVRFTTPGLQVDLMPDRAFSQIWPTVRSLEWPLGESIDDEAFVERVSKGLHLKTTLPGVALRPWSPATDLPRSETDGSKVQLPAPCGKHHVYYPVALRWAAMRGLYHCFGTACDCGKAYLVRTETDGAHFKAEGAGPAIEAAYEAIQGDEVVFQSGNGEFVCKRLR